VKKETLLLAVPTSPLAPLLPRSTSPPCRPKGRTGQRAMVNHTFVTDHPTAKYERVPTVVHHELTGFRQIASGSTRNGCPRQVAFKKPAARVEVARQ
jgi:hypothetical protein